MRPRCTIESGRSMLNAAARALPLSAAPRLCSGASLDAMALEAHFIYRPKRSGSLSGLGADVYLRTEDQLRLHALYLTRAYAYFTILYLHGHRGNLSGRGDVLAWLSGLSANVLGLDYRGYGQSQGKPSELGLYRDAQAAYDWLLTQVPAQSVIVLGEGLGSAPACELAAKRKLGGLILLSAFTNLPELAAGRFGWLPWRWVLRSRFDNLARLPGIAVPKLIVHSRADEQVPFEMGTLLFEVAAAPKQSLWLEGAGHDEIYSRQGQQLADGFARFTETLDVPG